MKRLFGLLIGIICVLLVATPVWAVANPDSISIGDVFVYRNELETGDTLIFVRYDVSYASEPSQNADETFQMAIYGTDGTTLLFTRPLNYYQHNVISIYLAADENTLTWGSAYYVRIMGNPLIFSPLIEGTNMETRVLASGDYRDTDDLGPDMVDQAETLEADWGTTLLNSSNKLNSTGSIYFQEAVPGLSAMVPDIFQLTTSYFVYEKSNFTEEGLNQTKHNLPVSLNNTLTGLDGLMGVTNHNFGHFGWAVLMGLVLAGVVYAATRRPDIAMLGGFMGVMGMGAYFGLANGNIMLFVMTIGTIIIVLFAVEYILPRVG